MISKRPPGMRTETTIDFNIRCCQRQRSKPKRTLSEIHYVQIKYDIDAHLQQQFPVNVCASNDKIYHPNIYSGG